VAAAHQDGGPELAEAAGHRGLTVSVEGVVAAAAEKDVVPSLKPRVVLVRLDDPVAADLVVPVPTVEAVVPADQPRREAVGGFRRDNVLHQARPAVAEQHVAAPAAGDLVVPAHKPGVRVPRHGLAVALEQVVPAVPVDAVVPAVHLRRSAAACVRFERAHVPRLCQAVASDDVRAPAAAQPVGRSGNRRLRPEPRRGIAGDVVVPEKPEDAVPARRAHQHVAPTRTRDDADRHFIPLRTESRPFEDDNLSLTKLT
jgi:hypothetical protein